MQKRTTLSLAMAAALLSACTCPSSFREVPDPGQVYTVAQVNALSRCQVKVYGTTLLGMAPTAEVARALLNRGAEPTGTLIINGRESHGSALQLATNPAVVRELTAAGCSPNVQGGADSTAPLCQAIRSGKMDLALTLLSAGADPNKVDSNGETPLYLAAAKLDARLCQVLINQGARLDIGSYKDGTTPLMAALKAGGNPETSVEGKIAVAELLLRCGANHLQADAQGNLPMHVAPLALMPSLMAAGASINCSNARGRTPLFYGGSRKRIEFLLQQGADINARDLDGYTVFDVLTDPSLKSYVLSRGGRSGKSL